MMPQVVEREAILPRIDGIRKNLQRLEKLYDVAKNHSADIEQFLRYIKTFLENPQKFGVTLA